MVKIEDLISPPYEVVPAPSMVVTEKLEVAAAPTMLHPYRVSTASLVLGSRRPLGQIGAPMFAEGLVTEDSGNGAMPDDIPSQPVLTEIAIEPK
jgi:hypothetical protein